MKMDGAFANERFTQECEEFCCDCSEDEFCPCTCHWDKQEDYDGSEYAE